MGKNYQEWNNDSSSDSSDKKANSTAALRSCNHVKKAIDSVKLRKLTPVGTVNANTKLTATEQLPRVRGLTNLGNTCFFNAVMQCLAQTPYLLDVLKESSEAGEEFTLPGGTFKFSDQVLNLPPIKGTLSACGSLTSTLAQTLEELQSGGGVYNPSKLFNKLCARCPQFQGGDQHDSHELLRHLLESVRSEDLKRYQLAILQNLGCKGQDISTVSEDKKQKCKAYINQAADRILRPDQVFRGFLVSTLTCRDCSNVSYRHEYFLDMSLPVSVEKSQPPQIRCKTSPDNALGGPTKSQLNKEKKKKRKAKRAAKYQNTKLAQKQLLTDKLKTNNEDQIVQTLNKLSLTNEDDKLEDQKKAARAKAKRVRTQSYLDWSTTIAPRYQCKDGECSVQSCLNNFTAVELMTGNNKVGCESCTKRINGEDPKAKTVYTNAKKQFLISSPPAVLILHLNRFQLGPNFLFRKLTRHVSFPMILDIAPFCGSKVKNLPNIDRKQKKLLYALYGVVEHSGNMYGGHYTAYVKVRPKLKSDDKRWKFIPQGSKAELDQDDEQRKKLEELLARERARDLRMKYANDSDYFSNSGSSSSSEELEESFSSPHSPAHDAGAAGGYEEASNVQMPLGKWYYVSDSRVTDASESEVLNAKAYLLFYERIY